MKQEKEKETADSTRDFTFHCGEGETIDNGALASFPVVQISRRLTGTEHGGEYPVVNAISEVMGVSVSEAFRLYTERQAEQISFNPAETRTLSTLAEIITGVVDVDAVHGTHAGGRYVVWANRIILSNPRGIFVSSVVPETQTSPLSPSVEQEDQMILESAEDSDDDIPLSMFRKRHHVVLSDSEEDDDSDAVSAKKMVCRF